MPRTTKIKFLPDRAIVIEQGKEKTLVVADLHIGLELELSKKGITLPDQMTKLEQRLDKLLKQTRAKRIVLLGDIKHETSGVSWSELWDVPEFLQRLKRKAKVSIVKGNHDGGIEDVAPPGIEVYEPAGFVLGDVLLTHGQAWPDKSALGAKTIVMGHIHPTVEFWSSGVRQAEHVFLRANVNTKALEKKLKTKSSLTSAIILPAFNLLVGGSAFNSAGFRPIGPLLKKVVEWKHADMFLLDGTFLGTLDKMKKGPKRRD
jgi:putative SbcD/Mre11-related phosphoesterase